MTYPQLKFTEWLQFDETRSRTFVAAKKTAKKSRPTPTVHHDLDSWLQHVDNLKKELELLKGKLADKKPDITKPDITKPEEPKKTPTSPKPDKDEKDNADTDKQGDSESERDETDVKRGEDSKPDRVQPSVADRGVGGSRRPVSKPPVPPDGSSGTKSGGKTATRVPPRRSRGIHGD